MKDIKNYLEDPGKTPNNGVHEIRVDSEPIKIWFGMGVIRTFQHILGKTGTGKKKDIDAELNDMDNLCMLLSIASWYADKDQFQEPSYFDFMTKDEMEYAVSILNEQKENASDDTGSKKKHH